MSRTYTGPAQHRCMAAIASHWRAFGEAPTRAELGRAMGITTVSAHLLVRKLARDGLVIVVPRMHRGVEIV